MASRSFERTFAALPPELQREVEDFAEFLLAKRLTEGNTKEDVHPLANLAGAWCDEPLSDEALLPQRTFS